MNWGRGWGFGGVVAGMMEGERGSCLRRNDGWGRAGMTERGARVPACAGMTELALRGGLVGGSVVEEGFGVCY